MTVPIRERLRAAFLDRPVPDAVFELAPGRLCGLRPSGRGRAPRGRVILPLAAGVLTPSFDRPNVADMAAAVSAIERGKTSLGLGGGTVSLLIPEPCVRVFILTLDSLPASPAERDSFIRWRVGKQMPLLPDDLRLAYDVAPGGPAQKVIVAAARAAVVREYEGLFESAGLRVGAVTVPTLSLVNLIGICPGTNGVLLSIETDSLSFLAIMDSGWTLFRQKGLGPDLSAEAKADLIVNEVDNTVHFIEDKERKKVGRIWVRAAGATEGPALVSRLNGSLPLSAAIVEYPAPEDWNERETAVLAPLLGQVV
jgi:hypothetical protein